MRLSPDGGRAEEEPPRDLVGGKPLGQHGHDFALTRGQGADVRIGRGRTLRLGRELLDHSPGPAGRSRDSPADAVLTPRSSSAGSASLDQELPNCGGLDRGEAGRQGAISRLPVRVRLADLALEGAE